MCAAVALARSELPLALLDAPALDGRVHERGGEPEVRFYWRAAPALLPVWLDGRIQLARWGNRDRRGRLPPTGWTWRETVEAGRWAELRAEPVVVPATYCLVGGVWFRVREGVQGLAVRGRDGASVYLIVERASRYFRVMTRTDWTPALVNETI